MQNLFLLYIIASFFIYIKGTLTMKFLSCKAYLFQLALLFQSSTITASETRSLPLFPDQNIHLSLQGNPLNYEQSWEKIFAEACYSPHKHLHMKVLSTRAEGILITALGSTYSNPDTNELADVIVRFNYGNSYPSHITIIRHPFIMSSNPSIPETYPTKPILLLTHHAAGKHGTGVREIELVKPCTIEISF